MVPRVRTAHYYTHTGSHIMKCKPLKMDFPGGSVVGKESAYQCRRLGRNVSSITVSERGNGNPLQYSLLENHMDRGTWQAAVHGVAKELKMTE